MTDENKQPRFAQLLTDEKIEELQRIGHLKKLIHQFHTEILSRGATPSHAQMLAHSAMFGQGVDTIELLAATARAMRQMIEELIDKCVHPEKLELAGTIVCLGSDPNHFMRPISGCPSCGWPKPTQDEPEFSDEEKDAIEARIRDIVAEGPTT